MELDPQALEAAAKVGRDAFWNINPATDDERWRNVAVATVRRYLAALAEKENRGT